MAVSEEFEPLLKEVVSAKRLSASKMNKLTELALKGIEHDSQLVSILYRTHKSLPMTSKVSSLYAFDALARAARSQANKSGIVGDIYAPTGNCATFLLKMEGVLDGLVQDLMATHSSEIQEKLRKVLDIWTKAGTFPPHVLARLSDMTIKKKDSPAPAPPQDPRIQAGPQAPMMVSPPPPPIAVAPALQAPPPVPVTTAPAPIPDVSLLMSLLNAAPTTQPAPASNPLAYLNGLGANGQPQITPNITDAAGALALIQQLASAAQQPPPSQPFPPQPPAPVQQQIPVPLPLAALTAGRNGVPPQHQAYPPVQYPNTNGAAGHPQHPLNVRSPPRPPGPRPHDFRSRSRSPPRGPGGGRWAPPAGPRNFSRDRGRDDFRGRERSRERFRDDRGPPPFRERDRDWDRDRRRRSFSRSRSPPPRGRFAPQGPRRDVRPYSPPRRPSNPTAAAAGGVGREEVRVAPDSGKDEFGRDIRARSGSPDDDAPRDRPAADDTREVDMEQETPPPADERPAPILTSASGTAPVIAGRPDANKDANAKAAGGGAEGGLEAFDFTAFNFGEPASWEALGKAWQVSYGSAPTQEQLVTLLMGNASSQNNSSSVNAGAGAGAPASASGGSGMMPVGQPIQTFVDSDRDQDTGSWRGGGGGRGGWRGGFRGRGRGGGGGGGHGGYGGGGYGHAGAGGHINGEWGYAGPGDASDPYGGSDAIVLGGGD